MYAYSHSAFAAALAFAFGGGGLLRLAGDLLLRSQPSCQDIRNIKRNAAKDALALKAMLYQTKCCQDARSIKRNARWS